MIEPNEFFIKVASCKSETLIIYCDNIAFIKGLKQPVQAIRLHCALELACPLVIQPMLVAQKLSA